MNLGKKTVLSLEQALTLPYATERFVQLGWRVIRIETPGQPGQPRPGDPNRYIGEDTGVDDLHAYFIAPNLGKEAITLNLKDPADQQHLKTIVEKLGVDVFLCNTLPKRYRQFGIDYETLREANPQLIWCGISAFGPEQPDRAGYDPALQAMLGYMFLTGEAGGDPLLCGLPLIDLRAGDEAFTQVLLALLEREHTGRGKRIDISMAQCAASWLITALPQLQFAEGEQNLFTRSGNEHRSFVPSNCYPTHDGFVYLAIGNDLQWQKLTEMEGFAHLCKAQRQTNNGRKQDNVAIYADIRRGLEQYTTAAFIEACLQRGLAVAPVNDIRQVSQMEAIQKIMVKTVLPDGRKVPLFPAPMSTEFLAQNDNTLATPPRLGEHNNRIFEEAGIHIAQEP